MNLRKIAYEILYKTIKEDAYSNLLMRQELDKVPLINRAFITNLVNGVLRKYEYLEYQVNCFSYKKASFKTSLLVIMGLYEKFYLNEKDYVVNNEYVSLAKNKYEKSFVNACLHNIKELKDSDDEDINACLPKWIYALLKNQYDKDELNKIFNIYQSIPKVYYRINKHKANFNDLKDLNIEILNDDIFISDNNLLNTKEYKNGLFYIQDYNSASLYKHLDLNKDNTLLDVCSAPGSKLFNCLDILDPKNTYSNDLNKSRVNLIKQMADKLGYKGINYLNENGLNIPKIIDKKFDRILLDAPCSGLGVLMRKPDLKFHIKPNSLDELEILQYDLLKTMDNLLNVEGIILYSTCTLNKKENTRLINKFIKEYSNYELLEEDTIINEMGDCFYYAKMRKIS